MIARHVANGLQTGNRYEKSAIRTINADMRKRTVDGR